MSETRKCSALIWSGFHQHGCSRKAVVVRDGKGYCRQHDPVVVKEQQAVRQGEYERQWGIRDAENAIADARHAAADEVEREDVTLAEIAAARALIVKAREALAELRQSSARGTP